MWKNIDRLPEMSAAGEAQIGPFSRLDELLAYHARVAPEGKAILAPGRAAMTYGALLEQASDVARALRSFGIGPHDRVAVVLPGGPETAVAMVAVAAAAVCVPLNPSFTADEWQRYLSDLRVVALLTRPDMESAGRGAAHALGIPVIDLSPRLDEAAGAFRLACSVARRANDTVSAVDPDDAFILLTSGSTSRPKIVPLTHRSVCLSAHNVGAALALGPSDRLLSVLPLFHGHGLISGLVAALAAGSSIACTRGFDAAAFFGWLMELRPTWYTAVPAIHRAVLSAAARHKHGNPLHGLRLVRSASSTLPRDLRVRLEALFGVPVIDTYGMTEAATQIAANPLGRGKPGSVGRAAGPEIAIMDGEGRRLPAGERGEIVLRGATITRGYDSDPAATAAAFRNGWFRTGDIGYLDEEGYVFIVGRIKDLINRGGQEVAPAEVEEALQSHPDVVEAAVFAVSHPRLGEDVAAAVVLSRGAAITADELRDFAGERLARFKVPALIRTVAEIPKDPAGKMKRRGLAAALGIHPSGAQTDGGGTIIPPRTELQRILAETWAELLELDRVGVDQDVYTLGADSLAVTQFLSRLRIRFGVELTFKDLFDSPTVAALASRIESAKRDPASVPSIPRATPTDSRSGRLSFQQQRMHVLSRLDPTGCNYHVVEAARLYGPLDPDALEASIVAISERHEVLRSTFVEHLGEPVQMEGTARPRLERLDISPCAANRRAAAIRRLARRLLHCRLDLEKEPLLQAQLLRLGKDDHALIVKLHHLVTDGWSQRLFWQELGALYEASQDGTPCPLPQLPVQYRHYAEWQRSWIETRGAEEQLRYWRAQLEGLTELPLRADRPRPAMRTGRGARHSFKLSRTLSGRIRALSRAHSATLFMTLLAAFQCLLYRYTGHEDVAVGSLIANRNQIEIERLIGMFANTIILRTDLSGDPTFSEVLWRVRKATLDAYRNQDLPIEKILQALHVSRSIDRNSLFQVMFVLQSAPLGAPALRGVSAELIEVDPGLARFDLLLELIDADGRLGGWFQYSSDLFEAGTIARMAAHLRTLLAAIVANPEERISRLALLPQRERTRILAEWSGIETGRNRLPRLSERFARQADLTPTAVAVSTSQVRLSYDDLARRVSGMADRLLRKGVGPGAVVVLLAGRSIELLAAMMAVQWTGGAFLPLDPMFPTARLTQLIQHSGASLILVGRDCAAGLYGALSKMPARARPPVLSLEKLAQARGDETGCPARPDPSSLGCVIYTSGSTGVPKGAMIEQRGLVNHLLSKISDLALSASDVVAQTAPQGFVIAVWQFLAPLMAGARIHICADEVVRDPALLAREIGREGITVLQVVPAMLRAILERASEPPFRGLNRLRWLISTGEPLTPDLCRDWFRHFPNIPLMNAYGASECSDDVATLRLTKSPGPLDAVPIGRPIANTRLYVLDAHLQPVPIGVTGELCVGGVAVGRGYLNDTEQTRRRFLRDPFSNSRAARLYLTGDQARWRADRTLECLGRIDRQVKIRGNRIEVEEIEHVLVEHPDIQAAVVLARHDANGQPRLVAHVVPALGHQPEVNELRNFLKAKLPGYMIPGGFIFLERLPLTAHGKVDRSKLMAMRQGLRVAGSGFVAPRNSTEEILAEIWAHLIEIEGVGVFDNFFELGGHSLLAGQVLARIANAFNVSLPISALFEAPTIAALAQRVDEVRERPSIAPGFEIARVRRKGPHQVSIMQEHVLRIEREFSGLPRFNVPFAYRLEGPLDVRALERSLTEVVARHDVLRASFKWKDEQPLAVVRPAAAIHSRLVLDEVAVSTSGRNPRSSALLLKKTEALAELEAWTSFDMSRAPLFRARLLRLGDDDHVLLFVFHHIIFDGWSFKTFIAEVSELYRGFVTGCPAQLRKPAFQFFDFARWQRCWVTSDSATQQLAYWKEQLRGVSPIFLMNGKSASALRGSRVAHNPVHFPDDLIARLSSLSRSQDATLFITLLTGFKALLLARTGRTDICVATAMANRSQQRMEGVIGPMVNTILIRTRIDADLTFQQALGRVREAVLEAHARQEFPFHVLAARLLEESGLDPASIVQVFFIFQNAFRSSLTLPDLSIRSFGDVHREGQLVMPVDRTWLTMLLRVTSSGIIGSCSCKTELIEPITLQGWLADYRTILANAAANPETSLGRLGDVL